MKTRPALFTVLITSLNLVAPIITQAQTLYKWVDQQGSTHYSDTIPTHRGYKFRKISTGTDASPVVNNANTTTNNAPPPTAEIPSTDTTATNTPPPSTNTVQNPTPIATAQPSSPTPSASTTFPKTPSSDIASTPTGNIPTTPTYN